MCQRTKVETVQTSVNRHKGAVERYVNQTAELSYLADRQFAIIMIRNARLTSHTMNAITFQLTTNSNSNKQTESNVDISLTT